MTKPLRVKPVDNLKLVQITDKQFKGELRATLKRKCNLKFYGTKLNNEPEFYFESLNQYGTFMKRVKTNKLEGFIEDEKFCKANKEIEKMYDMCKMGLVPAKNDTTETKNMTLGYHFPRVERNVDRV